MAKVSIGVPVYNGAAVIRMALDSLLAQSHSNFEVIISDNASFDETESICRKYAERDKRIRYIRHPRNIGALANFNFVLSEAAGEYFMWAAADDRRSADFLERNLEFLSSHPDYVASTSPIRFENGMPDEIQMGDFSLDSEDSSIRVCKFFTGWHANGRFYSLMRRNALVQYKFGNDDYLGADWAWVVHLATRGKLKRIQEGWVSLGESGESNTTNVFKKYNKSLRSYLFPFEPLLRRTLVIAAGMPFLRKLELIVKWTILNIRASILNIHWSLFGKRV